MIRNEVRIIKEEEIKDMNFLYFDNTEGVKNIIIDNRLIKHQVDFLNEIYLQLFQVNNHFERETEDYHWDQLKDYLGDILDFDENNKYHQVNIIIPDFKKFIKNFKDETYNYESIIEMFKVVLLEFECAIVGNAIPRSVDFYILEENIDILKLRKEMLKRNKFDYHRILKRKLDI